MIKCKAMTSVTLLTDKRHTSLVAAHLMKGPRKKIDGSKPWGKCQRDGRKEEESVAD